jgi:hypothetical protein
MKNDTATAATMLPLTLDDVYISFINDMFGPNFVFILSYAILIASLLISIFLVFVLKRDESMGIDYKIFDHAINNHHRHHHDDRRPENSLIAATSSYSKKRRSTCGIVSAGSR